MATTRKLTATVILCLLSLSQLLLYRSRIVVISDFENSQLQAFQCPHFKIHNISKVIPQCRKILTGEREEVCRWKDYHRPTRPDISLVPLFSNCSYFKKYHNYAEVPDSPEEASFPIAYSISMHKDVQQLERLLRMIYSPQNVYCIHVDAKAHANVHRAVQSLTDCFENVFISTKLEPVHWGTFSVIQAVLNCVDDLQRFDWKYFINIAGQDVPLKTNLEIVRILKILNGSNDVELRPELEFSRYWFKHKEVVINSTKTVSVPDYSSWNLPTPYDFRIYKGNLAAVVSRPFVQFVLNETKSLALIDWLKLTGMADEHLWSTLNHQSSMAVPGGYPDTCHDWSFPKRWISRYAKWRGDVRGCHGKLVHDVCVLGVGDLQFIANRPQLFVNKLYSHYQSAAFDCLEQRILERRKEAVVSLDTQFYQNMQSVQYHRWKLQNSDQPTQTCPMLDNRKISSPPEINKMIRSKIVQM